MPRNYNVRLTDEDSALVNQYARQHGVPAAEVLRAAVRLFLHGEHGQFQGVDAGFVSGRALANQVAFELLREALDNVPKNYQDAVNYLHQRQSTRFSR